MKIFSESNYRKAKRFCEWYGSDPDYRYIDLNHDLRLNFKDGTFPQGIKIYCPLFGKELVFKMKNNNVTIEGV